MSAIALHPRYANSKVTMDTHRATNQTADASHKGRSAITPKELAVADKLFDMFLNGTTLKTILGSYRAICEALHMRPNAFPHFYPKLKHCLGSWRAKALWKKFDVRSSNKVYGKGKLCPNTRVLIIGAGPCGLRTAIEAQLLGAKVVVIEKRDRMSRNNVLHLWPFVIDDLRSLGAKKFFGKFCAGAIDHISIRQLQCILLKVALLLGVEVHTEVSFERLVEPNPDEKTGWRAEFKPSDHPVSQYEFDVIIGADGKRNTLQGFRRKEFRGKLAIAITANFINKRTEAEARVEEISGVAFIFNQKFFKDLFADTGIDLENIVYYKDDTHYFVMTAKKASLIEKGVIRQDLPDTAKLLAPDNVDREALMNYAREAAEFSTNYKMVDLEFAVNHYGQPDVAMFDFTSMYAAENASRLIERHGYKLLTILVGDSLLEPFWPTGSGCARGFLSSLDAAWAIRAYGSGMLSPLEVIAERESIYRLLAQTTPENLNKDYKGYTLDPSTRYPNLNKNLLTSAQMLSLFDSDDPNSIVITKTIISANHHVVEVPKKRRRRDSNADSETLVAWIKDQVKAHADLAVDDITSSLKDGRVLCAIISHYRPDLLDYSAITAEDPIRNNKLAFEILEKDIGIPPVMTGEEMVNSEVPDYLTMVSYLTHIYDMFRCEIPHIKHPKLELPETKHTTPAFTKNHPVIKTVVVQPAAAAPAPHNVHRPSSRHKRHSIEPPPVGLQKSASNERKPRKRKTMEKLSLTNVEDRMMRLEEIAQNRADRHSKRRQQRKMQTDQFIKSMQMLQSNCKPDHSEPFEDYSIFLYRQTAANFGDRVKDLEKKFTYVPERENRVPSTYNKNAGEKDEDFQARIKGIEDGKWSTSGHAEKKPKDLLRAIGKIDNSDWNIKEIEKKIHENKQVKVNRDKERVPKWSKEQFLARQTKMEKQHLEKQDSSEAKYAEIDKNIKQLDQKLKEGTVRDLKQKKVAMITEKFVAKVEPEPKPVPKSNSKTVIIPTQGNSETCHFCSKRVYLMERLSAEGKFFHRGCFRCQYCHTALRLGSYLYDRDGKYGFRFYCSQHFGMPGELKMPTKVTRKPSQRKDGVTPEKKVLSGVAGVDLLDRVQTPERIEFANLSTGNASSDHDDSLSQMDEDEWTDRNFGASTAELGTSDDDSSSMSDTDSDDEDAFEEALDEPPTKEGTLKWAERFKKRYSKKHRDDSDSEDYTSSDPSSYYENSSGDDDSDTATEGEEEIRARELRKQEVRVEPPVVHTDTGTDTEVKLHPESPSTLPENVRAKSKSPRPENARSKSKSPLPANARPKSKSPLPENARSMSKSPLPENVRPASKSPLPQSVSPKSNSSLLESVQSKSPLSENVTPCSSDDDDLSEFGSAESDLEAFLKEFEQMEKDEEAARAAKINSERTNPQSVTKSKTQGDGKKLNTLAKSATVASVSPRPVKRNFVLPPKENRKSFGKEFIPAFKPPSPEPILIIKRTPSKINLPKEIKPKVAVKPNLDSATKYFGDASKKKPTFKKPVGLPNKLVKQVSLPAAKPKEEKKLPPPEKKPEGFNFDPIDDDLNDIDDYIENLIMNEDELLKPIDPNKYKLEPEVISSSESEEDDEKLSSSIEDLLKALETETNPAECEDIAINPDGKIEDLLTWMDDLDYQPTTPKIYRSFSDAKYKHLERALKSPERVETVVNKLSRDNIKYFEMHMAGKPNPENFDLARSKTEVACDRSQARRSVDFDAISKVDIKKVLRKFESIDAEEPKRQPPVRPNRKFGKRNSFSNFGKAEDERKFYASMCTVKTSVNPDFRKDLEINNNENKCATDGNKDEVNNNEKSQSDTTTDAKNNCDNTEPIIITEENLGGGVVSAGLVLKAMRDITASSENICANENKQPEHVDTPSKNLPSEEDAETAKNIKRNMDNVVDKISDLQKRMNQRSKSPAPDASRNYGGDFLEAGHLKTHLDPKEAPKDETLGFQKDEPDRNENKQQLNAVVGFHQVENSNEATESSNVGFPKNTAEENPKDAEIKSLTEHSMESCTTTETPDDTAETLAHETPLDKEIKSVTEQSQESCTTSETSSTKFETETPTEICAANEQVCDSKSSSSVDSCSLLNSEEQDQIVDTTIEAISKKLAEETMESADVKDVEQNTVNLKDLEEVVKQNDDEEQIVQTENVELMKKVVEDASVTCTNTEETPTIYTDFPNEVLNYKDEYNSKNDCKDIEVTTEIVKEIEITKVIAEPEKPNNIVQLTNEDELVKLEDVKETLSNEQTINCKDVEVNNKVEEAENSKEENNHTEEAICNKREEQEVAKKIEKCDADTEELLKSKDTEEAAVNVVDVNDKSTDTKEESSNLAIEEQGLQSADDKDDEETSLGNSNDLVDCGKSEVVTSPKGNQKKKRKSRAKRKAYFIMPFNEREKLEEKTKSAEAERIDNTNILEDNGNKHAIESKAEENNGMKLEDQVEQSHGEPKAEEYKENKLEDQIEQSNGESKTEENKENKLEDQIVQSIGEVNTNIEEKVEHKVEVINDEQNNPKAVVEECEEEENKPESKSKVVEEKILPKLEEKQKNPNVKEEEVTITIQQAVQDENVNLDDNESITKQIDACLTDIKGHHTDTINSETIEKEVSKLTDESNEEQERKLEDHEECGKDNIAHKITDGENIESNMEKESNNVKDVDHNRSNNTNDLEGKLESIPNTVEVDEQIKAVDVNHETNRSEDLENTDQAVDQKLENNESTNEQNGTIIDGTKPTACTTEEEVETTTINLQKTLNPETSAPTERLEDNIYLADEEQKAKNNVIRKNSADKTQNIENINNTQEEKLEQAIIDQEETLLENKYTEDTNNELSEQTAIGNKCNIDVNAINENVIDEIKIIDVEKSEIESTEVAENIEATVELQVANTIIGLEPIKPEDKIKDIEGEEVETQTVEIEESKDIELDQLKKVITSGEFEGNELEIKDAVDENKAVDLEEGTFAKEESEDQITPVGSEECKDQINPVVSEDCKDQMSHVGSEECKDQINPVESEECKNQINAVGLESINDQITAVELDGLQEESQSAEAEDIKPEETVEVATDNECKPLADSKPKLEEKTPEGNVNVAQEVQTNAVDLEGNKPEGVAAVIESAECNNKDVTNITQNEYSTFAVSQGLSEETKNNIEIGVNENATCAIASDNINKVESENKLEVKAEESSVRSVLEEDTASKTGETIVSGMKDESKMNLELDEEISPDAFVSLLKSIESEFRNLKEKQQTTTSSKTKKEKPKTNYFGLEEIDTGYSRADERIIDSMLKGLVGPEVVQSRRRSSVTSNLDAFRVKKVEEEPPKASAKPKTKKVVKKSETKDVQAEFDKITKSLYADKNKDSGEKDKKKASSVKVGKEEEVVVTDDVLAEFDKLAETLLQTGDQGKPAAVNKTASSVKKPVKKVVVKKSSAVKSVSTKNTAQPSEDDLLAAEFDALAEKLLPDAKIAKAPSKIIAKKSSAVKPKPKEILDEVEVSDDILAEFDKMAASLDVKQTQEGAKKKTKVTKAGTSVKAKQSDNKKGIAATSAKQAGKANETKTSVIAKVDNIEIPNTATATAKQVDKEKEVTKVPEVKDIDKIEEKAIATTEVKLNVAAVDNNEKEIINDTSKNAEDTSNTTKQGSKYVKLSQLFEIKLAGEKEPSKSMDVADEFEKLLGNDENAAEVVIDDEEFDKLIKEFEQQSANDDDLARSITETLQDEISECKTNENTEGKRNTVEDNSTIEVEGIKKRKSNEEKEASKVAMDKLAESTGQSIVAETVDKRAESRAEPLNVGEVVDEPAVSKTTEENEGVGIEDQLAEASEDIIESETSHVDNTESNAVQVEAEMLPVNNSVVNEQTEEVNVSDNHKVVENHEIIEETKNKRNENSSVDNKVVESPEIAEETNQLENEHSSIENKVMESLEITEETKHVKNEISSGVGYLEITDESEKVNDENSSRDIKVVAELAIADETEKVTDENSSLNIKVAETLGTATPKYVDTFLRKNANLIKHRNSLETSSVLPKTTRSTFTKSNSVSDDILAEFDRMTESLSAEKISTLASDFEKLQPLVPTRRKRGSKIFLNDDLNVDVNENVVEKETETKSEPVAKNVEDLYAKVYKSKPEVTNDNPRKEVAELSVTKLDESESNIGTVEGALKSVDAGGMAEENREMDKGSNLNREDSREMLSEYSNAEGNSKSLGSEEFVFVEANGEEMCKVDPVLKTEGIQKQKSLDVASIGLLPKPQKRSKSLSKQNSCETSNEVPKPTLRNKAFKKQKSFENELEADSSENSLLSGQISPEYQSEMEAPKSPVVPRRTRKSSEPPPTRPSRHKNRDQLQVPTADFSKKVRSAESSPIMTKKSAGQKPVPHIPPRSKSRPRNFDSEQNTLTKGSRSRSCISNLDKREHKNSNSKDKECCIQ